MIPLGLYEQKIDKLSRALDNMGNTPESLVSWLAQEENLHNAEVANLKAQAQSSAALSDALPAFESNTILGLKLTEPARARAASRIVSLDRERCFDEIKEVEQIQTLLHVQWHRLGSRIWAVSHAKDIFWERAREGGASSEQAWHIVDEIDRVIMPLLLRLRDELYRAIRNCEREIVIRQEQVERLDKKQLSAPKFNRRARRKRLARAALRAAAEKGAGKSGKGGDKKGGGGKK